MEIIGAGFCRSGTMSTQKALQDFGFAPCYHMKEVFIHNLVDEWNQYFDGNKTPLLETIEAGHFKSTLDFPIICIFDDLMKMHPNAKVLLTVRDTPEAWVKSFRTSVWRVMQMPSWIQVNQLIGGPPGVLGNRNFTVDLHDKCFEIICKKGNTITNKKIQWDRETVTDADLAQIYTNWIEYVKQIVPKDKLLIFNVKQGIEPLAKFCGKPIPSWKMPYVNDSATFNNSIKMGKNTAIVVYIVLAIGLFGIYDGCALMTLVPIAFILFGRLLMKVKNFEKDFEKDKSQ